MMMMKVAPSSRHLISIPSSAGGDDYGAMVFLWQLRAFMSTLCDRQHIGNRPLKGKHLMRNKMDNETHMTCQAHCPRGG